jgi:hypothetical protein
VIAGNFETSNNTIILGDGAGDKVLIGQASFNIITVGKGDNDVVNVESAGSNTITLGNGNGNGNGDVVNSGSGESYLRNPLR